MLKCPGASYMNRPASPIQKGRCKQPAGRTTFLKQWVIFTLTAVTFWAPLAGKAETVGGDSRSSPSSLPSKPGFDGQLAELHRKLAKQADQSAQLVSAQELREEGERLLKAGHHELAMAKLQSAFKLVESATESGASGPFPEFQFRLKRDLEEAMGTVVREEKAFDLTSNSLEALAILPEVQHYVEYFRGSGKLTFERARSRLTFYQGMMERIFEEEGIPREFIAQAQIESGFDPLALSSANARGLWQFVPETGQRYGLRQTASYDERIDPIKSTRAAARYLKDLFSRFRDWPLVFAAYNAGEHRIAELVSTTGSRSFWTLKRLQLLPKETAAYVPAVLAAIWLHRDGKDEAF